MLDLLSLSNVRDHSDRAQVGLARKTLEVIVPHWILGRDAGERRTRDAIEMNQLLGWSRSDGDEADQGSNPNDPSDGGQAPPPEDLVEVELTIGDHSGSHSERWLLKVGYTGLAAPGYGQVVTATRKLRRGASYAITVVHLGTNLPEGPDYDYTAHVTPEPGSCAIVADPQNLLGVVNNNNPPPNQNSAEGKEATLHLPQATITEIKGLYKADGSYAQGYSSDDNQGRIYSNRTYDPNQPSNTIWTKDRQYIDIAVQVEAGAFPLPPEVTIVWEFEDVDDPSNEDPQTHPTAGEWLDPNDYDGVDNDGDGTPDNSDGIDNTGGPPAAWEQLENYTLSNGNETAIVDGVSKVRFNVTDHGGDNFTVKVKLKLGAGQEACEDANTGIMTVWKLIDVEFVQMQNAAGLDFAALNASLAVAFVEFRDVHREVDNVIVDGKLQMGVNGQSASAKCDEYVTVAQGEFNHEGDPGWFFSAAANWYVDTSGEGGPPTLYLGPATILDDGTFLTLELPEGATLSDDDHLESGTKLATLPAQGEHRVMKTAFVFPEPDLYKDGIILYFVGGSLKSATIISHTQGAPGDGNGADIVYQAAADADNGPVQVRKRNISSVRLYRPGAPDEYITFNFENFSWDPATRQFRVKPKGYFEPSLYNGPGDPPPTNYHIVDHDFVAGSDVQIMVQGKGALVITGISPGPNGGFEGRTIVFTSVGGSTNTLVHEFGHGLGFTHICGLWDYRSNDTNGQACTMHYTSWYFMLETDGSQTLEPWSHDHGGPYFCEEHISLIRKQELENYAKLGWGN